MRNEFFLGVINFQLLLDFTGPDGGDGGNGGHVVITASHGISSLSHIPRVVKASSGVQGNIAVCMARTLHILYTRLGCFNHRY